MIQVGNTVRSTVNLAYLVSSSLLWDSREVLTTSELPYGVHDVALFSQENNTEQSIKQNRDRHIPFLLAHFKLRGPTLTSFKALVFTLE